MQSASPMPLGLRFGLFEVDLAAGELRKRGRRVTLQEQPFKVLALLLQRPGELVTREELQHALWPADTFIEFDESLNKAIQKVRQALGDSSDNPHVIETVPRRGYRFIAPVESITGLPGHPGEQLPADRGASPPEIRRLRWQRASLIMALAIAFGIIIALEVRWPVSVPGRVRKFSLAPKTGFVMPAISPDGLHITYVAASTRIQADRPTATSLWIRDLAGDEPREIEGTEDISLPFWSPDSEFVGFAARGRLWKVPLKKGSPLSICELSSEFLGGTWSTNGNSIVYSTRYQGIYEVRSGGGPPRILTGLTFCRHQVAVVSSCTHPADLGRSTTL